MVTEDANGNRVLTTKEAKVSGAIAPAGSPTATYESRVGGELVGLVGAKTNFGIGLTSSESALFDATGEGSSQRARSREVESDGVTSTTAGALQFLEARFRFRGYGTDGALLESVTNPLTVELDDTMHEDLEVCVANAQIQSGNTIALQTCHEAKGIKSATITSRAITLSATVEATHPIVKPWREIAKKAGFVEVYIELGAVDGERVFIHIPKLQVNSIADAEQDSLKQYTISGTATKFVKGDDEMALFFA